MKKKILLFPNKVIRIKQEPKEEKRKNIFVFFLNHRKAEENQIGLNIEPVRLDPARLINTRQWTLERSSSDGCECRLGNKYF